VPAARLVGGADVGVRARADEAPVVCPGEGRTFIYSYSYSTRRRLSSHWSDGERTSHWEHGVQLPDKTEHWTEDPDAQAKRAPGKEMEGEGVTGELL
jgi:hypothetical protein